MLPLAELVHQSSLLTLLLEALQRDFEGLVVLELDAGQNSFLHEPLSVLFPGRLSILYADCLGAGMTPETPLAAEAPSVTELRGEPKIPDFSGTCSQVSAKPKLAYGLWCPQI